MSTPSPITPDIADKLLRADLLNVAKKVRKGVPLTARERSLLLANSTPEGDGVGSALTTAKSFVELAVILGTTRKTIHQWKKLSGAPSPASNGLHSVTSWRDFIRARGLKVSEPPPAQPDSVSEDQEALKRKRLVVDIEAREFALEVRRGEFLRREDVRNQWTTLVSRATSALRRMLEDEAPPTLEGLTAVEMRVKLQRVVDEFTRVMSGE